MGFDGSGKHQLIQKMYRKLAPNISLEMLLWCCGIFRIPFEILPQYPTHAWKIVEPDQVAQSALTNFPLHLRTNNGKCFLLSRYSKTSQWVIFVSHFNEILYAVFIWRLKQLPWKKQRIYLNIKNIQFKRVDFLHSPSSHAINLQTQPFFCPFLSKLNIFQPNFLTPNNYPVCLFPFSIELAITLSGQAAPGAAWEGGPGPGLPIKYHPQCSTELYAVINPKPLPVRSQLKRTRVSGLLCVKNGQKRSQTPASRQQAESQRLMTCFIWFIDLIGWANQSQL